VERRGTCDTLFAADELSDHGPWLCRPSGALTMTSAANPPWRREHRPGLRFVPELIATFERHWVAEAAASKDREFPSLLARAAKRVLGVDGAALCVETAPGRRLPLGASDAVSATAERLQFTVGEGPCLAALAGGRPLVVTETSMQQRWPVLAVLHHEATPFRSGLAVPLRAGRARFGVLDLYLTRPSLLDGHDVVAAQLVAQSIANVLLETFPVDVDADDTDTDDTDADDTDADDFPGGCWNTPAVRRRREVWVAVGMVNLILGLGHDDALDTLRAHAMASGRCLDDLAHDLVCGHTAVEALQD